MVSTASPSNVVVQVALQVHVNARPRESEPRCVCCSEMREQNLHAGDRSPDSTTGGLCACELTAGSLTASVSSTVG